MSKQYLVDTTGKTVAVVVDLDTYQELVQAREELGRLRAAQDSEVAFVESTRGQHSVRELRGLGKEIWTDVDIQQYINKERDSWDG